MTRMFTTCVALCLLSVSAAHAETVRVFLLAGQSNMQGHGRVAAASERNAGRGSLEWLVRTSKDRADWQHLVDPQGKWLTRDDVAISYLERFGALGPHFGVREGFIGPELGFGHAVGDAFEEPVLLIKLAWGGKSLAVDFRPPGAGGEVGPYYEQLIERTEKMLQQAAAIFPHLAEAKFQLSGIAWHQGWNDRVNQDFNDAYEVNLAHLIRDLRTAFGKPSLPFVLAETGMSGREERHPRALSLMKAQAAVARYDEFAGNVAFVGTKDFYRAEAESPARQAYHWNQNAETYYLIGEGMGQAMVRLLGGHPKQRNRPSSGS